MQGTNLWQGTILAAISITRSLFLFLLDHMLICAYADFRLMDKQLTQQGFAQIAKKFRVLGDPVRLRILDFLRQKGELSVGEITKLLDCSQPNASRQLGKLFEEGIVARRRHGNTVFYWIEDFSIFELCEAMCGRLEKEAAGRVESFYEEDLAKDASQGS